MKKLLVFAVASLFALSISAQSFGVKAGYNMSAYKVNFWTPDGANMGAGFNAGLVAEMPMNDMMSLRADVTFNQKGSDYDATTDVGGVDMVTAQTTDVSYLNIGVGPKLGFGPAYVFVGPYFGYALSSVTNLTVDMDGTNLLTVEDLDNYGAIAEGGSDDLYNRIDFGLNLALGASFSGVFVEVNVGVGALNYINHDSDYYSVTNYADPDDVTVGLTDDATQNNLFFGFSVGYMLGGE